MRITLYNADMKKSKKVVVTFEPIKINVTPYAIANMSDSLYRAA